MNIGILKPNLVMTDVEKIFISTAHEREHNAFVFTAKNVNFETMKVIGRTLEKNVLVTKEFDMPDIIQNRLAVKREDVEVYNKLSEMIPFTSNRIGTKAAVYNKIKNIEGFQKYLIEVVQLNNLNDLKVYLNLHNKIIFKPDASNQAKGIVTLQKRDNKFFLKEKEQETLVDDSLLEELLKKTSKGYSVSPFIKSETCFAHSTVFRLHLTRGKNGQWQRIKLFPYININPNIDITNGMQGALITLREEMFLEQYYPHAKDKILEEIDNLFNVFKNNFQKKYAWRLDSIGLDLGITQDGEVYIYEINAGPGVGFMAYPVALAQVEYYEWLITKATKPYLHNFLPINLRGIQA